MTKLFQSKDEKLRRMMYLVIKELKVMSIVCWLSSGAIDFLTRICFLAGFGLCNHCYFNLDQGYGILMIIASIFKPKTGYECDE